MPKMKGYIDAGEGKRTAQEGKTHRAGVKGKKSRSYKESLSGASKDTHPDRIDGLREEA